MALNIQRLLADHHIPLDDSGSRGWVNTTCPFCQVDRMVLGWKDYTVSCWRCGRHPIDRALGLLLNLTAPEVSSLLRKYKDDTKPTPRTAKAPPRPLVDLPPGTKPLAPCHETYLAGRGFDPAFLAAYWDVKGITISKTAFRYRVIVPIFLAGRVVSFTSRAISKTVEPRWLSCADPNGAKRFLYGFDHASSNDNAVVIVEGVPSVWRLGPGAVATFGTSVTPEQLLLLSRWRRRFVLFDADDAGDVAGPKIGWSLSSLPGETVLVRMEKSDWAGDGKKDPGDLTTVQAGEIMRELLGEK